MSKKQEQPEQEQPVTPKVETPPAPAGPKPRKIYVSAHANRMFGHKGQTIRFSPDFGDRFGGPTFGVLDMGNSGQLAGTNLTAEEIEQFIESTRDFKTRTPGKRGIWLSDEGKSADVLKAEASAFYNGLANMSDAALRAELAAKNIPVPMNAGHDELVTLVLQANQSAVARKAAPVNVVRDVGTAATAAALAKGA